MRNHEKATNTMIYSAPADVLPYISNGIETMNYVSIHQTAVLTDSSQ
jgi:hypothetical protein